MDQKNALTLLHHARYIVVSPTIQLTKPFTQASNLQLVGQPPAALSISLRFHFPTRQLRPCAWLQTQISHHADFSRTSWVLDKGAQAELPKGQVPLGNSLIVEAQSAKSRSRQQTINQ